MTTLIVNADDFGFSESVNEGIVDAHTQGIVTSTTWLAGGDAASEALELARDVPQLEVGLHLALTDVRPVGDPAPFHAVLDAEGRWPTGYGSVLRWMRTSPHAGDVVATEWAAQVTHFLEHWGRLPSHLDSHQHIALIPRLMERYIELATRFEIHAVRIPSEVRRPRHWTGPCAMHRPHETLVLSALAARLRRLACRAGVPAPDHFAGFRQSGHLDERHLLDLLPHLARRSGTVELMVHPGRQDAPGGYLRRAERDALVSPRIRDAIRSLGFQLGHFADLP